MIVRELLMTMGVKVDSTSVKNADNAMNGIKDNLNKTSSAASSLATTLKGVFGAISAIYLIRKIGEMGDEWNNINGRIGLVTNSMSEQTNIQKEVFNIAQETRQEYAATGTLFVRMARFSDNLGATQEQVLDVTRTVNRSLVLGGASAMEARSTILQLSQALSSGRLQGDELRSLNESAPQLMDSVAKYFHVTIGELKQMGADGKLLSKDIFAAILQAKDKMEREFKRMPLTLGQAFNIATNYVGQMFFEMNKETGIFQTVAKGLVDTVKELTEGAKEAAKRFGGWKNVIELLTLALAALTLGFVAFKNGLVTLAAWKTAIAAVTTGIGAMAKAFILFLANPTTWIVAGIVLAFVALALVLEDIYTWVTGGKSVIGEWLGPWEDVAKQIKEKWDSATKSFEEFTNLRIIDVIKLAIEKVKELGEEISANGVFRTLKVGGKLIADWLPSLPKTAPALTDMQRTAYSFRANRGGGEVNQSNNININQNIAGAGTDLVNNVGSATSDAVVYGTDKLARDLQYSVAGGEAD